MVCCGYPLVTLSKDDDVVMTEEQLAREIEKRRQEWKARMDAERKAREKALMEAERIQREKDEALMKRRVCVHASTRRESPVAPH